MAGRVARSDRPNSHGSHVERASGMGEQAVAAWLEERTHIAKDHLAWSRDVRQVIEAATLLRDGRAAAALETLAATRRSADVPLRAWRALLLGRALIDVN